VAQRVSADPKAASKPPSTAHQAFRPCCRSLPWAAHDRLLCTPLVAQFEQEIQRHAEEEQRAAMISRISLMS